MSEITNGVEMKAAVERAGHTCGEVLGPEPAASPYIAPPNRCVPIRDGTTPVCDADSSPDRSLLCYCEPFIDAAIGIKFCGKGIPILGSQKCLV